METIAESIKERLKQNFGDDPELSSTLALVDNVKTWNAEGGKSLIEDRIKEMTKTIESKASADLATIKSILEEAD